VAEEKLGMPAKVKANAPDDLCDIQRPWVLARVMLSRTSSWLAGLKRKACNFRHNSSRLIDCSGSDIFPMVPV